MISVQHNMLAINANRQLNINTNKGAKLTEKLSSGYRINRAADDAAGLAISEKMRRQIRGLHQAADNIKDGIGYVQTAEGALNEVHDMLQRVNELAVKAANGTNTPQDREYIDLEVQALKKEIDRVFSTTTFNEQRIWDAGEVPETGGAGPVNPGDSGVTWVTVNAVTFHEANTSSQAITGGVTNANCGVLALRQSDTTNANDKSTAYGYTLQADDNGIKVTWTGFDGKPYSTATVPWDEIAVDDKGVYSFKMEDYFGVKDATNKLYTYNADTKEYDPVFKKTVSFTVNSYAAKHFDKYKQDIINSINGATMSSSVNAYMDVDTNNCNTIRPTANGDGVYISSPNLTYEAAYLSQAKGSGYNFDATKDKPDDAFIEPNPDGGPNLTSDPIAAGNGTWSLSFNMKGIGLVTATSTSIYCYSNDGGLYKTGDKDYWWYEYYDSDDKTYKKRPQGQTTKPGDLTTVKNGLSGGRGLISSTDTKSGIIELNFTITPNNDKLTYGKNYPLKTIGTFYVHVPVSAGDKENDILDKIERALNSTTVLDFTRNTRTDSASIGGLRGTSKQIKIPDPNGPDPDPDPDPGNEEVPNDNPKKFWVQAGTEAGQHIDIEYENLNIQKLGMEDTNVLTQESAESAIDEVKTAMQIVSKQRSDFGAYQNRLDHAYNIDKNVEENTQAAESLIRDTDIAEAMMEYSVNNILMQAGVSMLTQANQSGQLIIELLQQ